MLATTGADNQALVWDLALERDPEEEAALAPAENAQLQESLPSQLLFAHAGQSDMKELHWHGQIPGLLATTAADGFNVFRPSNI
jgi:ribosome assembly protein RRB1